MLGLQAQAHDIKSKQLDRPILGCMAYYSYYFAVNLLLPLTAIQFFFLALFVFFLFLFFCYFRVHLVKQYHLITRNTSQIRSGLELEYYKHPQAKLGVKTFMVWVPECNLCT